MQPSFALLLKLKSSAMLPSLRGYLHVFMELFDHVLQFWGTSDFQQDVEEPFAADQVKLFGEVDAFAVLCTSPVVAGGRYSCP